MEPPPRCRPHAVVFPYPAQGHLNPMLELSKRLACKGFTITFVVTEIIHKRLLEAGQDILDSCHTSDIRLEVVSDGLPLDFDRDGDDIQKFLACMNNMGAALEGAVMRVNGRSPQVTCMITDSHLPWTQDVADKFGIPRVFFWAQSVAVYSIHALNPHLLSNDYNLFGAKLEAFEDLSVDREKHKTAADAIACLPGLPPLNCSDLPYDFQFFGRLARNWVIDVIEHQFRRRNEAICVIANTFHELESSVLEALRLDVPVYPIGPLIPLDYLQPNDGRNDCIAKRRGTNLWEESHECREWLDNRAPRSVLYVSFGSVASFPIVQFHELALGLMASGQPFLWSIRRNMYSSQVSEILPNSFLERTKDQGLVVQWAPQLSVLAHPATGGFLSHCGWNSTLESISMGVPILALPRFGDQRTNCRLIVDQWKIGLELRRDEDGIVRKGEVLEKVKMLLQEEEEEEGGTRLHAAAEKLRNAARQAAAAAAADSGSSEKGLQRFIADITHTHTHRERERERGTWDRRRRHKILK